KKKKVILFVISATSCPNCKTEAAALPQMVSDLGEENIAVLEAILDGEGGFVDMDTLEMWDSAYGGTFTGAPANTVAVGAFLDPESTTIGTPYNVYIDADDMKVIKIVEGYDQTNMKSDLQAIINN
ncbi:redoxin domain-containing protein, partial [bacterium]|nr:redoxin domain-containing protein [bacterium]